MITLKTVLIFVTILFAVASMSFAQSQRPISTPLDEHKKPPSQSEAHNTSDQNFQKLPNNPVSTIKPDTSEVQEDSKNPKREREDKTTTDWWLVRFTAVLAVVGLIQFWILYRQTRYFQRTERAYVFATIDDVGKEKDFIPFDPSGKSATELYIKATGLSTREPSIRVKLSNDGKTPAILTRISADARMFSTKDYPPNEEKNIEYGEIPSGGIIIQSGKKFIFSTPVSISISQWKEIQAKQLLLVCWGRIEYQDVLGNSHKTGFCWEYMEPNKCFNISPNNTRLNYFT
jgi:hypothetical protein